MRWIKHEWCDDLPALLIPSRQAPDEDTDPAVRLTYSFFLHASILLMKWQVNLNIFHFCLTAKTISSIWKEVEYYRG